MTTSVLSAPTPPVTAGQQPRLLDQVAAAARQRGASEPTTSRLVSWVRAYVLFHGKRHPRDLDRQAVGRFLEHVGQTEKPPLPPLETARSALELLYGTVLGELPRPQPPRLWTRWLKPCGCGTTRRERRRAISTGSGSSSCSTASGTPASWAPPRSSSS